MIAPIGHGNALLEVIPGSELHIPDPAVPLTFSMVILKYQNRHVMAYNFVRGQWENPGGGIEPGESPDDCARREVQEETSQIVDSLVYKGLFKVLVNDHEEYGALYAAETNELRPFVPNEETDRLTLCATYDDLDGKVSILSRLLADFC